MEATVPTNQSLISSIVLYAAFLILGSAGYICYGWCQRQEQGRKPLLKQQKQERKLPTQTETTKKSSKSAEQKLKRAPERRNGGDGEVKIQAPTTIDTKVPNHIGEEEPKLSETQCRRARRKRAKKRMIVLQEIEIGPVDDSTVDDKVVRERQPKEQHKRQDQNSQPYIEIVKALKSNALSETKDNHVNDLSIDTVFLQDEVEQSHVSASTISPTEPATPLATPSTEVDNCFSTAFIDEESTATALPPTRLECAQNTKAEVTEQALSRPTQFNQLASLTKEVSKAPAEELVQPAVPQLLRRNHQAEEVEKQSTLVALQHHNAGKSSRWGSPSAQSFPFLGKSKNEAPSPPNPILALQAQTTDEFEIEVSEETDNSSLYAPPTYAADNTIRVLDWADQVVSEQLSFPNTFKEPMSNNQVGVAKSNRAATDILSEQSSGNTDIAGFSFAQQYDILTNRNLATIETERLYVCNGQLRARQTRSDSAPQEYVIDYWPDAGREDPLLMTRDYLSLDGEFGYRSDSATRMASQANEEEETLKPLCSTGQDPPKKLEIDPEPAAMSNIKLTVNCCGQNCCDRKCLDCFPPL